MIRMTRKASSDRCCSRELPLMMPCSKSFGSIPRCTLGSSRASQATHPPKKLPDGRHFCITPLPPPRGSQILPSLDLFRPTKPHRLPNHIASALSPLHICYLLSAICHHDVVVSTHPTGPRKQLVLRREHESLRLWSADRSLCARLPLAEAHYIVFASDE
jgi:hypothetical protein